MAEKESVQEAFQRIAKENPMKTIKCQKCKGECFSAHVSVANYLALYCDACGEMVYRCKATEIMEFDSRGNLLVKVSTGFSLEKLKAGREN